MLYFAYCRILMLSIVLTINVVVYRSRSTMSCCGWLHAIGDCRGWPGLITLSLFMEDQHDFYETSEDNPEHKNNIIQFVFVQ